MTVFPWLKIFMTHLYREIFRHRFSRGFTGTYEGVKTDVEAPAKIGDLISAGLKGELTPKQTSTIVSGFLLSMAAPWE